jgi:uncharacterized protein (DUF2236 family)
MLKPRLSLPPPLQQRLESLAESYLWSRGGHAIDFTRPPGEPALVEPDSVSWRVFKNPATLFIGGVAAVALELAEPRVRAGVWDHSTFRADPVGRMKRTGMAAMVSIYGPRSAAEALIARVVRMHGRVGGRTPSGQAYEANDPALLCWVQATAAYGFAMAYSRYVRPLSPGEWDRYFVEAGPGARLYGVIDPPGSLADVETLIEDMRGRLAPSSVLLEFLRLMSASRAFPGPLRGLQPIYVRAAVALIPPRVRERLGLGAAYGPRPGEGLLVRQAAALSDRIVIRASPAVQACTRLGLPEDYLYRDFV